MTRRNIAHLAVLLVLFSTSLTAHATGQEGDIIFINGEKWQLLGRPVYHSKPLLEALRAILPEDREWTTANWDGFTTYWSIKDDMLFMDSVLFIPAKDSPIQPTPNPSLGRGAGCIKGDCLLALLETAHLSGKGSSLPLARSSKGGPSPGRGQSVASWYSDTIRVAKGHMLLYEHSGYERHYETEMLLSVSQGRVTGLRTFNNCLLTKGFSFERFNYLSAAERDTLFSVDTSRFPELKDVDRVFFQISKLVLDVYGNLLDCQVKCTASLPGGRKEFPGLADDFKRILINIKPWQTYLVNGELVNSIYGRYTLPVKTIPPAPSLGRRVHSSIGQSATSSPPQGGAGVGCK